MVKKHFLFLLTLTAFVLGNTAVLGQTYHEVGNIKESEHFAEKAILVEDANHELQVEDILNESYDSENVIEVKNHIPYLDFTKSTYWMQLNIQNSEDVMHLYNSQDP